MPLSRQMKQTNKAHHTHTKRARLAVILTAGRALFLFLKPLFQLLIIIRYALISVII